MDRTIPCYHFHFLKETMNNTCTVPLGLLFGHRDCLVPASSVFISRMSIVIIVPIISIADRSATAPIMIASPLPIVIFRMRVLLLISLCRRRFVLVVFIRLIFRIITSISVRIITDFAHTNSHYPSDIIFSYTTIFRLTLQGIRCTSQNQHEYRYQ